MNLLLEVGIKISNYGVSTKYQTRLSGFSILLSLIITSFACKDYFFVYSHFNRKIHFPSGNCSIHKHKSIPA